MIRSKFLFYTATIEKQGSSNRTDCHTVLKSKAPRDVLFEHQKHMLFPFLSY